MVVRSPSSEQDWAYAEQLIQELQAWDRSQSQTLGFDPDDVMALFYPDGIARIRRDTAPPLGRLVLALEADRAAGVAAFRQLTSETCELYHVYVRPEVRGRGLGAQLLQTLLTEARTAGYRSMCLETATFMRDAHRLYRTLNFKSRAPYRTVPVKFVPVTMWLECRWLTQESNS